MTCRFPKSGRLSDAQDFAAIRREGRRVRSGPIILVALPAGEAETSRPASRRLGIVVSRRIGNAVERNRIKRAIREFFRCNRGVFPQGDCLVIPEPGAAGLENVEIRRHILRAIERLTCI